MTEQKNQKFFYATRKTLNGAAQIAYFHHAFKPTSPSSQTGLMFCGGFHSNMQGTKALYLQEIAQKHHMEFCRFDYQGHGQSSGQFIEGTIGCWFEDALHILDTIIKNPVILVGSSMGGWISLLLALRRPEKIKSLILLAPAPDFPTKLMWPQFTTTIKNDILSKGVWWRPSEFEGENSYPITKNLINESQKHNILDQKIAISQPVSILHGEQDEVVPTSHVQQLYDLLEGQNKKLTLIPDGDHRLSRSQDLDILRQLIQEQF